MTNADSKLEATATNIVCGSVPLDMNSQKIINLDQPVDGSDAATKLYVDSAISTSGGGGTTGGPSYMTFNITVGDVNNTPSSYTSSGNFITGITYTSRGTGKGSLLV